MQSGSELLSDAIKAIRTLAERKEVGRAVKDELLELAQSVEPVKVRVTEIEGLYAIDFGDGVDDKIDKAADLWDEVEPGSIRGPTLQSIRSASPLLSTLYVKGIDIERAYKFSEDEARISQWVGNHIDSLSGLLYALRKERRGEKDGEWTINVPLTRSLANSLNYLAEQGLIKGKKILIKSKEGKWSPFKWEWFRDDPDARLLIVYEKRNAALLNMLHGNWLNSYVYGIIDDQLVRHNIAFELYTEVVYKAPADVIRSGSDFDVIGRFRDTVICVECKSGKLDASRGQFDHIIQRTKDMRTVLSSMGTGEVNFLFYVVYDPEMNTEEEMTARLQEHDILPLRPNQVRSVMARTLDGSI